MNITPLDVAHQAMDAAPEDDALRLKFYEVLADSELFLSLTDEAEGEVIAPQTVEADGAHFVLAFDLEERLAEFAGKAVPYAALSGRALVGMLKGQGVGLGLNLDAGASSALLPPDAVAWLADTLAEAPEEAQGAVQAIVAPSLPEGLVTALDARLARAGGLAKAAWLVGAQYQDGQTGHLLALVDAVAGSEAALAKAVSEALVFSGLEGEALDVTFVASGSAMLGQLARVGLGFDLPVPEPDEAVQVHGGAPGMDPGRPPKLR